MPVVQFTLHHAQCLGGPVCCASLFELGALTNCNIAAGMWRQGEGRQRGDWRCRAERTWQLSPGQARQLCRPAAMSPGKVEEEKAQPSGATGNCVCSKKTGRLGTNGVGKGNVCCTALPSEAEHGLGGKRKVSCTALRRAGALLCRHMVAQRRRQAIHMKVTEGASGKRRAT